MGDRDQADEKTNSQRTRSKSHRVIVQDSEDWEKVDIDARLGGKDSRLSIQRKTVPSGASVPAAG